MRFSFLILFLFTLFSGALFSQEMGQKSQSNLNVDYSTLNCVGDRVYVTSDQVLVSDEGIFLLLSGCDGTDVAVMVSQLNFDAEGIFVLGEQIANVKKKCWNNHDVWHDACGGCGVAWCPARCKCNG